MAAKKAWRCQRSAMMQPLSRSAIARCLLLLITAIAAFAKPAQAFIGGIASSLRSKAKDDLIGKIISGEDNSSILRALEGVERLSFGGASLSSPNLPGNWLMVWTTSDSIAGKTRPGFLQVKTPPEQLIDIENGLAVNAERVLGLRNEVEAELTPATQNKVKVQFKKFNIGPITVDAPESLKGELSVTYLDEDMRISRGDQGNAFILLRESNKREEADQIWTEWRKSWS